MPGSDIQKLKTKHEQLTHNLNLVNVIYSNYHGKSRSASKSPLKNFKSQQEEENARAQGEDHSDCEDTARKKIKKQSPLYPQDLNQLALENKKTDVANMKTIPSTLLDDFTNEYNSLPSTFKNTLPDIDDENCNETAFRFQFIYEANLYESLSAEDRLGCVDTCWKADYAEFKIGRANFPYLPEYLLGKISREHATIVGYRNRRKEINLDEAMMLPTPEDVKISQTYSQNTLLSSLQPSLVEQTSPMKGICLNKPEQSNNSMHFAIYDDSPNKTYVLTDHKYGEIKNPKERVKGKFKVLKVGDKMELRHLDIVGLKVSTETKEVVFGFQFLCDNL